AAAATGADLLWRVKASLHLPVVRELPGGSFLAHVSHPAAVLARTRPNGGRRRRGRKPGPPTGPLPASPSGSSTSGSPAPAPAAPARQPRSGRRPGRGRSRDPGLPDPPAPGPHLPPRREQATLALAVQAQPRRPAITTRQLHHHHHRTRPPHPNHH